jgi:DNA-binding MarR family transcriptional regulator
MKKGAYARRTDPQTSHDAADRVDVNRLEGIVLEAISNSRGLTSKEIAEVTGLDKWSVSPRIKPLRKKNLVWDSGKRRDRSIVWLAF